MTLVHQFCFFLFVFYYTTSEVMSNIDIQTFFPQIKSNLTQITWAHAVNNQSYLDQVLANDDIMMIEADVLSGTDSVPIMGHPPATTSDLTLQSFLKQVDDFNSNPNITEGKGKGVKLDFKSLEAFQSALTYVTDVSQKKYPVWINADILAGPGDIIPSPVNSAKFLSLAKTNFPELVLSIGWTTTQAPGKYTDANIKEMVDVINANKITNNITFPVRASLVALSAFQMKTLLSQVENSTLTIWSGMDDTVYLEKLRALIFEIGLDKIFIDVPDDLKSNLRLDSTNSATTKGLTMLCLLLGILSVRV